MRIERHKRVILNGHEVAYHLDQDTDTLHIRDDLTSSECFVAGVSCGRALSRCLPVYDGMDQEQSPLDRRH